MPLRLIFMGTPDFSVPTLAALVGQGHEIVAVYSQPPRPAGRGMAERKSPVNEAAERFGLNVLTPKSLKGEAEQAVLAAHGADAAVVVAYGLLLPKPVLEALPLGCWNGHASLLPRWRGAAPIQRAIMAGDRETGVMIMRMEEGLDTGPVAMAERVAITQTMTASDLHDQLSRTCADLMVRAMGALERGQLDTSAQSEEGVTYAAKIDKAEARINWSKPAQEVHDHIRGLSPFPGAWCEMPFGGKMDRVKILRSERAEGSGSPGEALDAQLTIACGTGAVKLTHLQRAGKSAQNADEFLRGNRIARGDQLS
jgi:methionyl-tRNA formyltransferase